MSHFHGSVSGHVHTDGTWSTAPAFGAVTAGETSLTFQHLGGGTHYRVYPLGGSAGSWVAISASPVTVSGLTVNTEYTLELSANGSTVAATTTAGTLNPATGGGGVVWAIEAPGIASVAAFGAATVSVGALRSITDAGALASTAAFGVPTVTATTAGAASITNAGGIGSSAAFGIATLSPRLAIVVPGGIGSGLSFGTPVVRLDGEAESISRPPRLVTVRSMRQAIGPLKPN